MFVPAAALRAQAPDGGNVSRQVRSIEDDFAATLSGYSDDGWQFTQYDSDARPLGTRTIDHRKIVRYGDAVESRSGSGVVLNDGSLIIGRVYEISAKQVLVAGDYFSAKLPTSVVRAVHWHAPDLAGLRSDIVERALNPSTSKDQVELVNGDRLEGSLEAQVDQLVYRAGEVPRVRIVSGNTAREIEVAEVRAIYFSKLVAPVALPEREKECWIGWRDGSWINSSRIEVIDPRTWSIRLHCGVELLSRGLAPRADCITCVAGNGHGEEGPALQRLDLLEPLRVVHTPRFGTAKVVQREEKIATPHVISAGTRMYHHVIAMESGTQAIYRLPSSQGGRLRFRVDAVRQSGFTAAVPEAPVFRIRVFREAGQLVTVWEEDARAGQWGENDPERGGWMEVRLPPGPAVVLEVDYGSTVNSNNLGLWVDPIWVGS